MTQSGMITKYRHNSNLQVLLEPIPNVVSASVGLWIKSGSRDERNEQYGYAHFLEHMLFKGTENYSARDIAKIVDRIGGQHNAATNREYTCYYINVISDYLELALGILADMYYNSLFSIEEIGKEKNVIIEEIRMYEDTPDEFIHDLFLENMLKDHPLSHSILGTEESISEAGRDGIVRFYDEHYFNKNAILVIAGNFSESDARRYIDTAFPRERSSGYNPVRDIESAPSRVKFQHIDRELEQVHLCLGADGIQRSDNDRWSLYALSTILGGNMSSRLFQKLRENEGICYTVFSFHSSYTDHGVFGIYCATSSDNFYRAVDLIVNECRELVSDGITESELEDAKTFLKGNLALSLESVEVRMGQLAKNEIFYGKYFSFEDLAGYINSITLDDFNRVARRLFMDTRFSIVSVGNLPGLKESSLNLTIS